MKKQLLAGLAVLGAMVSAPAMAAVSVGDTVTCGATGGLECSSDRATVGNNGEFGIDFGTFGALLTADFSTGLLTISNANNLDFPTGVTFDGAFKLFFTNATSPFTFAALGAISGVDNLSASDVSLDDDGFVTIDLSNTKFSPDASVQVRLDPSAPQPAVPEPATWAMMILGFGMVGVAVRRRRPTTTLRVARA
ncbi:PEPxxWA-CTERM sorting domain-containing protein [uncultured Sphingomonas sp.]|uniref:PEPxxWA-CTERM sorting domain-containing protein n=1 Tax=uncultured Sphingomonas sp. TaxID=158754 RepID=UPI003748FC24